MLVATKLGIPRHGPRQVARPRLYAALSAGLSGALTLVSAPPGYGKTTLVAGWLADRRQGEGGRRQGGSASHAATASYDLPPAGSAWVSLDEEDSDPQLFFGYLAAALPPLPGARSQLAELLQSARAHPGRTLMKAFIADVSALDAPLILVLDDFHSIESAEIGAALGLLLDHPPPGLHLVILTRSDPGLPLARLRARGALSELRAADLRFSADEAAELLVERLGLTLSPPQVRALERRTEGWVAGLQLAALAMRSRGSLDSFVADFTGSHRFIMDYLTDEVLARLEPELQAFLAQTAALPRMSAPLCDAVVEGVERSAAAMLARLEAENSFLVPLDDRREWYRYHHLFAALLRQQLPPARATSIRRRAARWSAEHGLVEEAVAYALAGADHEFAAALLVEHGLAILFRGRLATLQRWLDALPPDLLAAQPRLCTLYAWVLLNQGRLDAVEPHLLAAERAAPGIPAIRAVTALIRSNIARTREDLATALAEARLALELGAGSPMTQGVARFQLGAVQLLEGRADAAEPTLAAALDMGRQSRNLNVTLLAGGHLGLARLILGRAEAAEEALRAALAEAAAHGTPHNPLLAFAQLGLGHLALARGDAEGAWAAAARALAACHETQELGGLRLSFLLLARVERAAGRAAAAQRAEEQADLALPGRPPPAVAAQLAQLASSPQAAVQALAEPLSERELDILGMIAGGSKNQEIADLLVISLNTVLYHTKNIYGKLGVNRRTGAVARARELGLL